MTSGSAPTVRVHWWRLSDLGVLCVVWTEHGVWTQFYQTK
jgi:hypothetical protein